MQLHCKRKRKSLRQTFELIANYAMIFFFEQKSYKNVIYVWLIDIYHISIRLCVKTV